MTHCTSSNDKFYWFAKLPQMFFYKNDINIDIYLSYVIVQKTQTFVALSMFCFGIVRVFLMFWVDQKLVWFSKVYRSFMSPLLQYQLLTTLFATKQHIKPINAIINIILMKFLDIILCRKRRCKFLLTFWWFIVLKLNHHFFEFIPCDKTKSNSSP